MYDAFQYFRRMAQLVADDPAAGEAPAAPTPRPRPAVHSSRPSGPSRLIKALRGRGRNKKDTAGIAALNAAPADTASKRVAA
jgi:hypothetical protein